MIKKVACPRTYGGHLIILWRRFCRIINLGAVSFMQKAKDVLTDLDFIASEKNEIWSVLDPGLRKLMVWWIVVRGRASIISFPSWRKHRILSSLRYMLQTLIPGPKHVFGDFFEFGYRICAVYEFLTCQTDAVCNLIQCFGCLLRSEAAMC